MKSVVKLFLPGILIIISQFSFSQKANMNQNYKYETATFGSGCFWCTEAIFERVKGVSNVTSGYSGGTESNPTYELIGTGSTRYAEVTQIQYDPEVISFQKLLEIFWKTHDPTTPDRQGADVGPQYRSVIFFHNDEQKNQALFFKDKLEKEKIWQNPIVTEISPFISFYPAEGYHQDFYSQNPDYGYCRVVITPKIEKFEKIFSDQLK
jgi:peptide-methionine (S)-S-oxide reductase